MYGYKAFDLYVLKKQFGQPISVVVRGSKSINVVSGDVTVVESSFSIPQAIVAPPDFIRSVLRERVADTKVSLIAIMDFADLPTSAGDKYQDWRFIIDGRTLTAARVNIVSSGRPVMFHLVYEDA